MTNNQTAIFNNLISKIGFSESEFQELSKNIIKGLLSRLFKDFIDITPSIQLSDNQTQEEQQHIADLFKQYLNSKDGQKKIRARLTQLKDEVFQDDLNTKLSSQELQDVVKLIKKIAR